jgi:predicted site-specific integrase-resolvase
MKGSKRVMTATVFAKEMDVAYSTVIRWLERGLVPGAVIKEAPDRGKWWEIPESALKMERPKAGRKKRLMEEGD